MFRKLFKTLTTVSAYNRTYNELQALTDFELRDIGICRGEIHDIAREAQLEANAKRTVKSEYKLFEVHP
jgi:uncharacterized protein YjiS (DUF1127 family)